MVLYGVSRCAHTSDAGVPALAVDGRIQTVVAPLDSVVVVLGGGETCSCFGTDLACCFAADACDT